MLEGMLSPGAVALYESMLREGPIPLDGPTAGGPSMAELLEKGFARRDYRTDPDTPQLVAVEPARAVDHAILAAQQSVLEQSRQIQAAREHLDVLQAIYRAAHGQAGISGIEVLDDAARVAAMSVELCLSAREEFLSFATHRNRKAPDRRTAMTFPAAVTARGVVLRNVYERSALEFAGAQEIVAASVAAGWQLRVAPELPMRMVIADRHAALVPLGVSGADGALLVRTPNLVAALRVLFDLIWAQAVPLGDTARDAGTGLTPAQTKVLELLATGMTDGAIARHLGSSERTVRRHVSGLLEALQADNRVAAVYAAVRRGWLA
ncbi:LuxR C-terminal-related transcriptional regulator [Amycolatopsis sp.]|uniref:LuxR C-terminal-related transcriptional regulator n=1 Tax=Amycolatopsis sp. TaxID=37632 RepID=UPI002D7F7180|nr:LuxR C-terminal-related transcriptional regulator [Amycolatopsis sp.]HET6709999.1 LuxR C-terminal-related transcriptional regulator [Amycolatopsis sp.]